MSFLARVTAAPARMKYLDVRHGPGLTDHVIETGEYLGASYLAGRVNAQYGDKAAYRGVQMTYGGGILLKLAAVVADVTGYGGGGWSHHANTLGNAFIGTHFAALGAQHGNEAASKGSAPALPAPKKQTALGAIPPARTPGKFLDMDECDRLAAMHG